MTAFIDLPDGPAWLIEKAEARMKFFSERMPEDMAKPYNVIMTPLTEPSGDQTREEWERTCDNCGTYVPETAVLYQGVVHARMFGKPVEIVFGACSKCADQRIVGKTNARWN